MKRLLLTLSTFVAAGATASAALVGLPAIAGASASTNAASAKPPYEPDHNSVGGLFFYNSKGTAITSGSLTSAPFAAYVKGTNAIRNGDTKATLYGFQPVKGEAPGQFSGEQLTTSDSYPNSKAPKKVHAGSLPLVSLTSSDETLGSLYSDFPNPPKAGNTSSGLYQIRLITSRPGQPATATYDSADIAVSGVKTSSGGLVTGGTWQVVYSANTATATHTTLKLKPKKKTIAHGKKVKLSVKVSPKAAGTVTFENGKKVLKKVKLRKGKASFSTKKLKVGKHKLRAIFTPTSTAFASSKSKVIKLKVKK
jgi:Bacterial Ig-like domain (group 3)